MVISYNWLSEYLPVKIEAEKLGKILTSTGLEVESMEKFEEVKGGLEGLVLGEVLETSPHPSADKLTLTRVSIGNGEPLQIVCGAPNVATGQKVVVATVGTTIYPSGGDPLTMKVAKIRGTESHGMICAEDEIGLGSSHAGIMVLPENVKVGTPAADYFKPYSDWIFHIGLTPNRMDAMSHLGVARDVCAYLSHHDKKEQKVKYPYANGLKAGNQQLPIKVSIENSRSCQRYSGVSIAGIEVKESPRWLQQKLKSIGLRPINNIVDITNFVQHETGQPLHAFDADAIKGRQVIVKNLPEGTRFISLDEKERILNSEDLMICDAEEGICIAGVFGGLHSGVSEKTKNIFLESAWFNPVDIRRTSFRHDLRTDAATRFEKGVDISNTVNVLKRAALMIREITGGTIASEIVDIYPDPKNKTEVSLKYHFLKKLSGKNYHPDAVKHILQSLGFTVVKEGIDELRVAVPFHKPDVSLPADLVEEVLRIDGLDNIEIPERILISPSVEEDQLGEVYREKLAGNLAGLGFSEIMTNSITHSAYYTEEELAASVKMINNLSEELDMMRLSMLETGLQSIAWNLNRKNNDLKFFEYGKTYHTKTMGNYTEKEHLCLYVTGEIAAQGWRGKTGKADFYYLKGVALNIVGLLNTNVQYKNFADRRLDGALEGYLQNEAVVVIGNVKPDLLAKFDIRQPVVFADLNWDALMQHIASQKIEFKEIPKYPAVHRDLAMIVSSQLRYEEVESAVKKIKLNTLLDLRLFDVFESDKLGPGKKSMAVSFTFLDEAKTLTDMEIDGWMQKIMTTLEKEVNAEIRK